MHCADENADKQQTNSFSATELVPPTPRGKMCAINKEKNILGLEKRYGLAKDNSNCF
jgi:hypothetical protein